MYSESTILILSGKSDDEQEIARILADQYRVIEVESFEEGLSQLSNGVDAVVADLDSAKSPALELLQRGKAQRPEMPFLAITNKGDVGSAVEAMKLGAADCLVKPVNPSELQGALSELIENRRKDVPPGGNSDRPQNPSHIDIPPGTSLEELERAAVEQALAQHAGNRTHAAKTLGISVRTLQRKLKAWGIPIVAAPSASGTTDRSRPNNFILPPSGGRSTYSAHAHSN